MTTLIIRRSRIELGFVCFSHSCALAALVYSRVAGDLLFFLVIAIGFSQLRHWLKYWGRTGERVHSLCWGQQHCSLVYVSGARCRHRERTASLPRVRYFSEFLIILSLDLEPISAEQPGSVVTLALWPDSLNQADDRCLRRYLRFDYPQFIP